MSVPSSAVMKVISEDLIVSFILNYLGLKESALVFSLLSKDCRKKFKHAAMINKQVRHGKLIESSGRLFWGIIDEMRMIIVAAGCGLNLSAQAEKYLREGKSTTDLRQMGLSLDALKVNGSVFTYWYGYPSRPHGGVLQDLKSIAVKNPPITESWTNAIERDVKYWKESRLFGVFYVFLERSDGTILISNDFRKVYLVLGIAQSIGEVFIEQTPIPKGSKRHRQLFNHPFPELSFNGPTFVTSIVTTLLPWENKIVYDGLASGIPLSQDLGLTYRTLVKVYTNAVDKGLIISSLPKRGSSLLQSNPNQLLTPSNVSEVTKKYLEILRNATPTFQSDDPVECLNHSFLFRRRGYSEKENPHHIITVLSISTQMPLVVMQHTEELIPSVEEYVRILSEAVHNNKRRKPPMIMIDALERLASLELLLLSVNIQVSWYPPPSPEESFVTAISNPNDIFPQSDILGRSGCEVCHKLLCSDGLLLLECSRCKDAVYCSRECQKVHWKIHKSVCK